MRIGKIASSAKYSIDEQFQNFQFLQPNFGFSNWIFLINMLSFQFGQFQKIWIWKFRKISNFKNDKNFLFKKTKKFEFGKFQKLPIWKIPKNFELWKFQKFPFWKSQIIPKFYNFKNRKISEIVEFRKEANFQNSVI